MHIRRILIENIRSIKALDWHLPASKPAAGWHVVIGDNGSGKTSFLRSIALAMVGGKDAAGLRLSWDDWLRRGEEDGNIHVTIRRNPKIDKFSKKGEPSRERLGHFGVQFMTANSKDDLS
jgi:DNA repair exonuclease SbcCD ATPase subunit